ncbi:MAG: PTS sugar transporter subunit IIA [Acidobacteria bacterium]|nr:PTS sugar transporter subunit IIA [Acidobacteriota bacterium]MBU4204407.1 PTS sugar transporter subunit IIA [Acidobacteriota bacterium]MBU4253075.1 PTS sugar transporter subunit IIA [Acidobacteriota bacterium]MBU4330705.1 PTS sugar transporter subunit IIA [Acidobacteriota bacterium]
MIMPNVEADEGIGLLKEMLTYLKDRKKISKDKDLLTKLLAREKLGSTAIGGEVAIPHCKMKGLKKPIVLLAVSRKGIDFSALDKKPTRIFFLIISCPDNPSLNLQILAAIAHLIRKAKNLKKKILEAESGNQMLDIIREEEEQLHD